MKMRLFALVAVAPLALGAVAWHDFNQDYDKARNVATSSVEIVEGQVLSISHNGLHWRPEIWQSVQSGATKQYFDNGLSWYRKIASASVPSTVKLGTGVLAAGKYTVYIQVAGENSDQFSLVFEGGDEAVNVPIQLKAMDGMEEDHLMLILTPRGMAGSKDFQLKMFYGNMYGTLKGQMMPSSAS